MENKLKMKKGDVFNYFTVIDPVVNRRDSEYKTPWCLVRCKCGVVKEVKRSHIYLGTIKSCGCLTHHYLCGTPAYRSWAAMKDRCYRKKHPHYDKYGGAGITVCKRWHNFKNFYEDMGSMPENKQAIDRINGKLGYFKENCRWVTNKENNNNMKSNVRIEFRGISGTISQWAEYSGLKYSTLKERLNRGWSLDDCFHAPLGSRICINRKTEEK